MRHDYLFRCMLNPERLFEENEKLAYDVVHKMKLSIPTFTQEDLFQTAKVGLWRACKTYDEQRSKFSTWAVACITNELLMAYRKHVGKSKKVELISLEGLCECCDEGLNPYYFTPRVESFEDSLIGLIDAENLDLDDEEKQILDMKKYFTESEVEQLNNASKWSQRKVRMKARQQVE